MSDLLEDLRDIRALLEEGGLAPNDLISRALDRLEADALASSRDRVQALHKEVVAIESLMQGQKATIAAELEKLGRGQEMLRGYSSLRTHDKAQRLNRRA